MLYEYHSFKDDDLKIIYHLDKLNQTNKFAPHLHRNVELLLMKEGTAEITVDHETVTVYAEEMVVIAPNRLHKVKSISEECYYYCLIVDHSIYEQWFSEKEIVFPLQIKDDNINSIYKKVFSALEQNRICYKQEVKAYIMLMLSLLFRMGSGQKNSELALSDSKRLAMTRKAISYMYQHFSEDISIDDICNFIGFSKYYFCRSFKEITGQTPIWHLNYIRCQSARSFLRSGNVSVTECASKCGFNNASYFCKIYRRYFGRKPKEDMNPKT